MKNYYELLGITRNSTDEEIKNAYRKAAQQHHPDMNPGDETARERFKEIHEAYEVLSNPSKRTRYDRSTFRFQNKPSSKKDGGFSFDFQNVQEGFFGKSSFKGRTITIRVELELFEVAFGCEKPIKISRRKRCVFCKGLGFKEFISCEQCNGLGFFILGYDAPFEQRQSCQFCDGKGKIPIKKCDECQGAMYAKDLFDQTINVKIPAGVENGAQLKLPELGEESLRGGTAGDVILNIVVKPHQIFTRDGLDLLVDIPVSFSELALGSEVNLVNLNLEKVVLKIPAGTQSHAKLRLKNQGLLDTFGTSGDIIVTVKCETPKNLQEDYQKLFFQMRDLESKYLGPKKQLWIEKSKVKE